MGNEPTVNTTHGPVSGEDLGVVLPHEHLFINLLDDYVDGLLRETDLVAAEVAQFGQLGGTTLVDLTGAELTRGAPGTNLDWRDHRHRDAQMWYARSGARRSLDNVRACHGVAETAGVRVILGTGHYRDPYLDREWFDFHPTDAIADLMVEDIVQGYGDTGIRAGIIGEIGANLSYISSVEERSFRAAARAQKATGVALSTHAARWPVGIPQLDLLDEEGVALDRVIIGHCDHVGIPEYHLEIARRGAYVQFDTIQGQTEHDTEARIEYIERLWSAGFGDRILLSQDICRRLSLTIHGGAGYAYLLREFVPRLETRGFTRAEIDRMMVDNPRRVLVGG